MLKQYKKSHQIALREEKFDDFKRKDVLKIHSLTLRVAMRMNYYSRNQEAALVDFF